MPTSRNSHLLLLLLLTCWFALTVKMSHATMAAKDPDPDLAIAQKTLKDDALAHRLKGELFLKDGLRGEAIGELSASLLIDPQDELTREYLFSVYYNRAQELLEISQEAYKAREFLEKAIEVRPSGVMAYYFLGSLNFQEKRDEECITTLLKVVDSIPEQLRSNLHAMLYNCAFNLLTQKKAVAAREVVTYLSSPLQATVNELSLAATISLENGNYSESIQLYDRVLSKDPLHVVALHNRDIAQQRLAAMQRQETKTAALKEEPPPSHPAKKQQPLPAETPATSKR